MPSGDRTGPEGRGSRTGRQLGYCIGNDKPGRFEQCYGGGRRRSFFGSGRNDFRNRNSFVPEANDQQQSWLKNQLDSIIRKLSEITDENKRK